MLIRACCVMTCLITHSCRKLQCAMDKCIEEGYFNGVRLVDTKSPNPVAALALMPGSIPNMPDAGKLEARRLEVNGVLMWTYSSIECFTKP